MTAPDLSMAQISRRMLSAKAEQFTESVIREMTRLALKNGAVNLSQGFPDFAAPQEIKEAARKAISDDINQYAITWGAKPLRDAIVEKFERTQGVKYDPEREITICCGSTEAMMAAMMAIINPGDEIVVFEPFYENYGPDAILSGATPRFVKLRTPDWSFDENYDAAEHISMARIDGMRDRTIVINGLSKTYSVTGWRVGWVLAPPEPTKPIRKVHDFLTVGAAAPLQQAGASALHFPQSYYDKLAATYAAKRERLLKILTGVGFTVFKPRGAYYIMTDIAHFADPDPVHFKAGTKDVRFAKFLVEKIGVAVVPGSSFYNNAQDGASQVRFTFCKKEETLAAAEERLAKLRA